ARRGIRHLEDLDLAALRINSADVPRRVPRVPERAIRTSDDIVGEHPWREIDLLELAGLRIEDPDVVPHLAHEPDLSVRGHRGIPGSSVLPGDRPLLDLQRIRWGGTRYRSDQNQGRCEHGSPPEA